MVEGKHNLAHDDVVLRLVELLSLKPIETNVYFGQSQDLGFHSLYGGQVLGQALIAAGRTVEKGRMAHSLQGYFLRPGDPKDPIYYEVDLIRTGHSFSTRRVVAKQNGLAIFSAQVSFQLKEEGYEHQFPMPQVQGPEHLESEEETIIRLQNYIPEPRRQKLMAPKPIELRNVDQVDHLNPKPMPPTKHIWTRVKAPLPDDPLLHQAFLAYASDFGLSTTSLLPHGLTYMSPRLQIASIDHAMWFHRPLTYEGWFLHAVESISTSGSRGLNRGVIFTQDGKLVASVVQEGLLRMRT